jgi:FkbM family methyltransferase
MNPYTQSLPYFGQWGEDRWLAEHLVPPSSGVFVDIGAGDGSRGSNSLYFENRGWTGLCVDPDPRNRAALTGRRCAVRTCAVSTRPGRRTFSMYDAKPSWSGLGDRGNGYTTIPVDCRILDDLLTEAKIDRIDLLSIDVEGDELDVWASFNVTRHQPGIVIIEYDNRLPDRSQQWILSQLTGYQLVHRTPANLLLRGLDAEILRRWPDAR